MICIYDIYCQGIQAPWLIDLERATRKLGPPESVVAVPSVGF